MEFQSNLFNEVKANLTMRQVAKHFGFQPNRAGFILSPFNEEKTPSCKLYAKSFYDFSAATGGDLIYFAAAVSHVSNWQACQYLVQAFSLPVSLSGITDNQTEIIRQQLERQQKQQRQHEFREALSGCIDNLKRWSSVYRMAIEDSVFEPFSDAWCFCVQELQKAECQLDVLCAVDCKIYPRLKANADSGLPSDRPQWLLDVLEILQDRGTFTATGEELKEIKTQLDFEFTR